jgi:ribosomal protein S18 acetylase RimI-like enzyme
VRTRVRTARAGDIAALLTLEAAFPTDRLDRRGFRYAIAAATIDIMVIEVKGCIAGYGMIHRRTGSPAARLASIAVDPERTGQGLGAALLAALEHRAQRHGGRRLRLEVRVDNGRAQRLYEGSGYRRLGTVPAYYQDGETALRLEKDLTHRVRRHRRPAGDR